MGDVIDALARLRRRMMARFFIESLAVCGLAFAGLLLLIVAINAARDVMAFDMRIGMAMLGGTFVSALVWTWLRMPTLKQTAVSIDTMAVTHDRFLTAYDFSKLPARTPLETAAMRECEGFIAEFDARSCAKFTVPRALPWLIVPAAALCLLALHANLAQMPAGGEVEKNAEAGRQARELEKMAQTIAQAKSGDLKKIADEIRKSEKRIKAAAPDQAVKAAFQETSSLESMIEEMLGAQKKASPEELAALTEALKQSELTKDAATALENGKMDQAADKLDQLLQQQKENPQLEKTGQAIEQALAGLTENQKGEISREMQRQAQSGASGQKDAGAQALQRLAEMLRKAGGNAQGQNNTADSGSAQAMKNILAELQNMKYGNQSGQAGADSKQGDAGSKVMVQSFNPAEAPGQSPLTELGPPSGTHGDHDDTGTTKDPYGPQQKKSDGTAAPAQLNGMLGTGQSLHDFITAAGDRSQSSLRYKELYNAMLPAAEEAVMQENIPPGSRFYIKRYFENIRPKE